MIYISSMWSQFRKKNRNVRQTSGIGFLCHNLSRFRSEYTQNVTFVRFHPPVRQGQTAEAFRHNNNSTLMGLVYDHKLFEYASCMLCVTLTYIKNLYILLTVNLNITSDR